MEPVRTCVGCRTRASRSTLIRVVVSNGEIVFDERAVLPGRGAWLHPTPECLTSAVRKSALARALRVSSTLSLSGAEDMQTIEKRLNGYGNKVNGSK